MAIVALESQRQRCVVVGEDLGTVPAGFRDDAAQRAILSYRVLLFERENGDGAFLPPADYPELAAAAVSTHDLPTLAGLWTGRDLEWRRVLGLYPDEQSAHRELAFRRTTCTALVAALVAHGHLARHAADRLAKRAPLSADAVAGLVEAVHCYLAASPCRMLLVQLEDLAGEIEQMNLPGTIDEHPNWRRKLQWTLDHLFHEPAVIRLSGAIAKARAAARHGPGQTAS
jgi:4-alpha-glucanotransferase